MDLKHVCKFCKKRFPCGRSLGGHIRSHLIHKNNNSSDAPNEEPELQKPGSGPGYELRENPKKTNKATDLVNSPPSSWSTESETVHGSDLNQKRNPARRSSLIGGNNSHSSVSEVVEPEQEEVAIAMCLIMLSRDVGNWGDISSSVAAGFSDDISLLQVNKTRRRSKREKIVGNTSIDKKSRNLEFSASGKVQNGSKMKEFIVSANGFSLNDQSNKLSESKYSVSGTSNHTCVSKKAEHSPSGHLQNGGKMKAFEVSANGFSPIDQNNKHLQNKRKVGDIRNGSEIKEFEVSEDGFALNDQRSNHHGLNFDETAMNSELLFHNSSSNNKRSKFECTTCNKVFHSYQALGGHRASHKKLLGLQSSPVSKLGNDIVNGEDHPPTNEKEQQQLVAGIVIGSSSSLSKKVVQKHECPICFRVFPSGQALGGHKRSHLLASNNNNNNNNNNIGSSLIESSSSPENRDLLDLNLPPASAEEETASGSDSFVGLIKPYWWVKSSKHEPILGLISN